MGCGCGRSQNNSGTRNTNNQVTIKTTISTTKVSSPAQIVNSSTPVKETIPTPLKLNPPTSNIIPALSAETIKNRNNKCQNCPYRSQSGIMGRCLKSNRFISRIVVDGNFKCPIGRY